MLTTSKPGNQAGNLQIFGFFEKAVELNETQESVAPDTSTKAKFQAA